MNKPWLSCSRRGFQRQMLSLQILFVVKSNNMCHVFVYIVDPSQSQLTTTPQRRGATVTVGDTIQPPSSAALSLFSICFIPRKRVVNLVPGDT